MLITLVAVEGAAVAVLGVLVAGLLRGYADVLKVLHEMGAGLDPDQPEAGAPHRPARRPSGTGRIRPAADLSGVGLDGAPAAVAVTGTAHDTLLAFLSTGCSTCQPFWRALSDGPALPAATRLVVVVRDPAEESPARLAELAPQDVPLVMSTRAWEDYEVPGSPHVVHVEGATGRVVGEGAAGSWAQVLDLLGQAGSDRGAAGRGPHGGGRDNARRIDAELAAAGIGPGHPSLYPHPQPLPWPGRDGASR